MKNYFKLLAIVLAVLMIAVAFAACGKKNEQPTDKQDDPIPAEHTHAWDEGKVTKEATCTEEGEKTFACSGCNETKIEKIAALGHTWNEGEVTKEATCTEEGEKTRTCTVCGATETEAVAKLAHTWDEGVVTKEATTEEEGEKTFTCTVCGETKVEAIEKLPVDENPEEKGTLVDGADAKYLANGDNTYTYLYYTGDADEVIVPATLNGKKVVAIAADAFSTFTNFTKVTISEGIKTIGASAFEGCTGLGEIVIPDSVEKIGEKAFKNCSGVQSVKLGNGLTTIPADAFAGCTSIVILDLGNGMETIPAGAFASANNTLVEVTIGTNMSEINAAFEGAKKLCIVTNNATDKDLLNATTNANVVAILKNIADAALDDVEVKIVDVEGYLFYFDENKKATLVAYVGDRTNAKKELVLPADADGEEYSIGICAFEGRTDIEKVQIAKKVNAIGMFAFRNAGVKEVTFEKALAVPANAFTGCSGITVKFVVGVNEIIKDQFKGSTAITAVELDDIDTIGENAFEGTGLTAVTFFYGIETVGKEAFKDCTALATITYKSTTANWSSVTRGVDWASGIVATQVACTDGNVVLP